MVWLDDLGGLFQPWWFCDLQVRHSKETRYRTDSILQNKECSSPVSTYPIHIPNPFLYQQQLHSSYSVVTMQSGFSVASHQQWDINIPIWASEVGWHRNNFFRACRLNCSLIILLYFTTLLAPPLHFYSVDIWRHIPISLEKAGVCHLSTLIMLVKRSSCWNQLHDPFALPVSFPWKRNSFIEWPGLKRTTMIISFQHPCHGQGCQPPDQAAQSLAWMPPAMGHP